MSKNYGNELSEQMAVSQLEEANKSVYYNEIWNAAIEAAALRIEQSFQAKYMAEQIRKLKK